jgi:hypothetical protein
MPRKSTGPYLGPPSWLSQAAEKSLEKSQIYPTKASFVLACMSSLMKRGLTVHQAAEVTSNSCNESGWGRSCWWGNAGGWKITKTYADQYKSRNAKDAPWWKARGNVDSGDPDWCFYRVFPTLEVFLQEWCSHFIPRPGSVPKGHRYKITGEHFWADDSRWFGDLIAAGYKGSISQIRMRSLRLVGASDDSHPSVAEHYRIALEVLEIWAQDKLHLDTDGAWGPKSQAKCRDWQLTHGLVATGFLDKPTLLSLSKI